MAAEPHDPGFFVGYLKGAPRAYALTSLAVAVGFLVTMSALSLTVSSKTSDPGNGNFLRGQKAFLGVLEEKPYPLLRMPPSDEHPNGRALMLTAARKEGVQKKAATLAGQLVDAGGFVVKRGPMNMLNVAGKVGLRATESELSEAERSFQPAPAEPLGRWRLVGEICDGKCYAGAMRPGTGLAHKACANLCVSGGVPPVFVSSGEVAGSSFFLLADPDGEPLPDGFRDLMAVLVEIVGDVERRDDLLIFKTDLATAKVF